MDIRNSIAINSWHVLFLQRNWNAFVLVIPFCAQLVYMTSARIEAFILICTALVQLMTPGLAFFYGGLVKDTSAAWQNWTCWIGQDDRRYLQGNVVIFFLLRGMDWTFEILKHITRWFDRCHEQVWGYVCSTQRQTKINRSKFVPSLYSLGVRKKKGGHSPVLGGVNTPNLERSLKTGWRIEPRSSSNLVSSIDPSPNIVALMSLSYSFLLKKEQVTPSLG